VVSTTIQRISSSRIIDTDEHVICSSSQMTFVIEGSQTNLRRL